MIVFKTVDYHPDHLCPFLHEQFEATVEDPVTTVLSQNNEVIPLYPVKEQ